MGKVRYIKLFKSYYKDFYVAQTDVVSTAYSVVWMRGLL
jgi:hypothetical protein